MGCFLSEPLAQLSPKVFFDEVDMDLADQREQPSLKIQRRETRSVGGLYR